MALQHLHSSTANKRPTPGAMSNGQLAINLNTASPGLFFKDSAGALIKVGPVHVGTTAPNASPAAGGQTGNTVGEQWLDTTGGTYVFKVWDGSAWRSETGTFVDVNGDVMTGALGVIAGSAAAPGLYFSGDTNTGLYSPGADQLALSTNGTGRVFVDASGNVGIVKSTYTSPAYSRALEISATDASIALRSTSSGTYANQGIYFAVDGTEYSKVENFGVGNLLFKTGSSLTERARITSDGKLGLGTSAPAVNLVVQGTGTTNAGLNTHFLISDSTTAAAGVGGSLQFEGNYTSGGARAVYSGIAGVKENGTDGNFAGSLRFYTRPNGNSPQLAMTIDSSQRVGVGTASPSENLSIAGGANLYASLTSTGGIKTALAAADANGFGWVGTTTNHSFSFFTNNTERARITSDGKLGLGTSSPGALFSLGTSTANQKLLVYDDTANKTLYGLGMGSGEMRSFAASNGVLTFGHVSTVDGTTYTERLRIDSSGNVGVGTTNPAGRLDVRGGTIEFDPLDGADSTRAFNFNISGNNYAKLPVPSGSGGALSVHTGGIGAVSERARIDSSGRLLVGTSTARQNYYNLTSFGGILQLEGTSSGGSRMMSLTNNATTNDNFLLVFAKSNGASVGSNTLVTDNTGLGEISFQGNDGAEFVSAASIKALVDGTPGANDMPGRLVFSTTADGASSSTERMRISSDGRTWIGTTGDLVGSVFTLHVSGTRGIVARSTGGAASNTITAWNNATTGDNVFVDFRTETSDTTRATIDYNRAAGQVRYNVTSDARLKSEIVNAPEALPLISQIKVRSYKWKETGYQVKYGFVAQELVDVEPDAVKVGDTSEEVNEVWAVDPSKLVPLLTAALQEAVAKIESLEARLTAAGI